MKTIFNLSMSVVLVSSLALSSCVSKGKFLASEARSHKLQNDSLTTHRLLNECN
ncbi:MAG: hypothetical protein JWO06_984, partial [Bacteroidota bacterium]|nr:hypothetical protein [Bacteroidota bacterium]